MSRRFIQRRKKKGWIVKVLKESKPVCNKYFGDNKYDGIWNALRAAKAYRAEVMKEHGIDMVPIGRTQLTRRNTSNVLGVNREIVDGRPYWTAYWRLPPKKGKTTKREFKRFAVHVFGEEGAKAEACALRKRKCGKLVEGKPIHALLTQHQPEVRI